MTSSEFNKNINNNLCFREENKDLHDFSTNNRSKKLFQSFQYKSNRSPHFQRDQYNTISLSRMRSYKRFQVVNLYFQVYFI